MQHFDLPAVLAERDRAGKAWLEFLRVPELSAGVYHLKAGQDDRQQPHGEDEVYYVLSGRGQFRAGGELHPVAAGTVLFVERRLEHRFVGITDDLTVLVFFAPAEGSRQSPPS